jgi:hypothetical protein
MASYKAAALACVAITSVLLFLSLAGPENAPKPAVKQQQVDLCAFLPECPGGDCRGEQHCLQGLCSNQTKFHEAPLTIGHPLKWPAQVLLRSPVETLKQITLLLACRRPGIYLRFGDGDLNLLEGKADSYQEPNAELASWLQRAFSMRGFNVVKAFPLFSDLMGFWPGTWLGVHVNTDDGAKSFFQRTGHFFIGEPIYSNTALHHTVIHNPQLANNFLAMLKSHCPIFVGNVDTPAEVRNALFGVGHVHIPTPAQNAWSAAAAVHDRLVSVTNSSRVHRYHVVVVAAGCSGRAIGTRLWLEGHNPNLFIFDFGSLLDWLTGQETRDWIKQMRNQLDVPQFLGRMAALPSRCA